MYPGLVSHSPISAQNLQTSCLSSHAVVSSSGSSNASTTEPEASTPARTTASLACPVLAATPLGLVPSGRMRSSALRFFFSGSRLRVSSRCALLDSGVLPRFRQTVSMRSKEPVRAKRTAAINGKSASRTKGETKIDRRFPLLFDLLDFRDMSGRATPQNIRERRRPTDRDRHPLDRRPRRQEERVLR